MDRADIVNLIRDRLGFNQGLDEAVILRHMDLAQKKYENGEENLPRPWFTFDETYEDQTQASIRTIELPETFVAFNDQFPLLISYEGVWKRLYRRPVDKLVVYENETGFPTHYDVQGQSLFMYPLPDAAYDVNIPHYCRLDALSTDADSVWFEEFPSLILEETLVSLCKSTRDEMGLKIAVSALGYERDGYMRRVEERMHVMQDYIMGGDDA